MNDEQPLRLSFGPVAEAYDRGRPSFTAEAAAWLVGERPLDVLELGAGTGKLTAALVELGHRVHATDPDEGMLDVLARNVPDARTTTASAEELPFEDKSFDVVVVAQAFHWFDHEPAISEIARVLRPGGHIALVWHVRDSKIPWVRRLGSVLGTQDDRDAAEAEVEPLITSRHFGVVEDATFKNWQVINRESVVDLALSRSQIAALEQEEREAAVAAVVAFYDDYGRGMDGMQLPYLARCFRAQVVERTQPVSPPPGAATDATSQTPDESDGSDRSGADEPSENETTVERPRIRDTAARAERSQEIFRSDGTDTDMLLIDFR